MKCICTHTYACIFASCTGCPANCGVSKGTRQQRSTNLYRICRILGDKNINFSSSARWESYVEFHGTPRARGALQKHALVSLTCHALLSNEVSKVIPRFDASLMCNIKGPTHACRLHRAKLGETSFFTSVTHQATDSTIYRQRKRNDRGSESRKYFSRKRCEISIEKKMHKKRNT